ncbi:hypothetical protein POSPLADRAFT_1143140 [Postia placenta MAD-698-R-SB12]|uniref:Uncharacterized protein n=1 Tax=Postia placenta MAD-698-R-SB12 TaxID=670580 RepID=A0A1X6N1Z9_9APHY|nr:hypothetical protein POSPLADRAFT_1143140 [Postia placenta MAD-698-R-SB12]OSX62483.1 hypothetical protein POSPLADRAFT_1143140 [Postia placenta MAD-698-R-SB12]
MDNILKALGVDKDCKIAVLQYERDGRGVGKEEELHWAIVIQTVSRPDTKSRLPCFQVYDLNFNDKWGKQWQLYDRDVVYTNPPTNRPAEWNCRDWVMEVIKLFAEKGWICASIPAQSTLLPSLRRVSVATTSAYAASTRVFPVIVELAP